MTLYRSPFTGAFVILSNRPKAYDTARQNTQYFCRMLKNQLNALMKMYFSPMMPLTTAQVNLLKLSYKALNPEVVGTVFYDLLFEHHPHLRPLFPTDLDDQKAKLMSVLELVIYSFDEKTPNQFTLQENLMVPLRHLGIKHEEKGILPEHYPVANELLINALEKVLGHAFAAEVKNAWALALQHLTSAMLNLKVPMVSEAKTETLREIFLSMIRGLGKTPLQK